MDEQRAAPLSNRHSAFQQNGTLPVDQRIVFACVRAFDAKWLRGEAPAGERFVGSGDIQSLADLGNSLEVVRSMRIAPITRDGILRLVGAILVPIVPLVLTMMPLEELAKILLGMVFREAN